MCWEALGGVGREAEGGNDQNTLYMLIKFSKNKTVKLHFRTNTPVSVSDRHGQM